MPDTSTDLATGYDDSELRNRLVAVEATTAEAMRLAAAAPSLALADAELATPYLTSASISVGGREAALPTGHAVATDIRHFGVVVQPFDGIASEAVARQNLQYLQEAIDWSAATGGLIQLPAGAIDIYGTAMWQLGAAIRGAGKHSSRLRQTQLPRSDSEPFADLLVCPPVDGRTGGTGFTLLADLILDGGWNLRNHAGVRGAPNWSYDPARMTQRAVVYDTPNGGPAGASASREASSDAHNRLDNVTVANIAGCGIQMSGRGENFIRGVELRKCAVTGLLLDSPDCFISDLTSYAHGDSGVVITARASNLRFTNSKMWFTGMQRDAEVIGAGIHLPDQGTAALTMSNISTQDSWGPGLHLSGDAGISFHGDLDEAGGGRLEQQGIGWGGPRSQPRCFLRAEGTLRRARIDAQIKGGGRTDSRPHLLHLSGSGIANCDFRFGGDLSQIHAQPVLESNAIRNARRHNEVWFGQRLLHGHVTQQQLQDASHGVNDPTYGPSLAYTSAGEMMCRAADGYWRGQQAATAGFRVMAFEHWDEAGFQAAVAEYASDPLVWVVRYAET